MSKKNSEQASIESGTTATPEGLTMTIGKGKRARTFIVADLKEATAEYQKARDASGEGSSKFKDGHLSTGERISYNGRVWRGDQLVLEADGTEPIEPVTLDAEKPASAETVQAGGATEQDRAAEPAPKAAKVAKAPKGKKAKAEPGARSKKHAERKENKDEEAVPGSLPDISARYIAAQTGMTVATRASYQGDLNVAARYFGEGKKVSAITKAAVLEFFQADVVMKKRNGKPKSPLSINKTRRALRQALEWAAEKGLIKTAPVPEIESAS